MRARTLAVGAVLLGFALSCGPQPRPRTPAPGVPAVALPAPERMELWHLPTLGDAHAIGDDGAGNEALLLGALRGVLENDVVRFASDAPRERLVGYARDRQNRWWFATRDGVLLRSEGFLGHLERLADLTGEQLSEGFVNPEVLAVRDGAHRLVLAREGEGLVRPSGPLAGRVLDVGFNLHGGLVAMEGGALWRTTDLGATAAPFDLHGAAAFFIGPSAEHYDVLTTRGALRVDAQGQPSPLHGAVDLPEPRLTEAQAQAVASALLLEHPWRYPLLLGTGGKLSAEGRVLLVSEGLGRLLISGPERTEHFDLPANELCVQVARGWAVPVLACATPAGHRRLVRLDGEGRWRDFDGPGGELYGGAGGTMLAPRLCEGEGEGLCFFDGNSWSSRSVVVSRLVPRGLWRDRALAWLRLPGGERLGLLRLEGANPTARELHVEGGGEEHLAEAVFLHEHFVNAWAPGAVFVGDPEGILRRVPLPEGATRAGFLTAEQGVATDSRARRVWSTTDGGARWTRLALPLEASSALPEPADPVDPNAALESSLLCFGGGCQLSRSLQWLRANPAMGSPPRLFVNPHDVAASPREPPAHRELSDEGRPTLRCVPPANRAGLLTAPQSYGGAGGVVEVRSAGGLSPSAPVTLSWTGVDAQGRPVRGSASSRSLVAEGLAVGAGDGGPWLEPRWFGASGALLEYCVRRDGAARCATLLGVRGRLRVLPPHQQHLQVEDAPVELSQVLPLADGGWALHFSLASPFGPRRMSHLHVGPALAIALRARAETVLQLDATGAVRRERGFAWSAPYDAHPLAERGGRVGLLVRRPAEDAGWLFYPLDGAEPEPVELTNPVRPCGTAEGAALRVVSSDPRFLPRLAPELFGGNAATVLMLDALALSRPEQWLWRVRANGDACVEGAYRWDRPTEGGSPSLIAPLVVLPRENTWQALWLTGARPTPVECH